MRFLLDTHVFIWWDMDAAKLSSRVQAIIDDQSNILILSVASIWEMQIKIQSGKLVFPKSLPEIIRNQQTINNIELLPVTLPHVLALNELPDYHKDPFDRLLVAQTHTEGITLISHDPIIAKYPVPVIW